MSCVLLLSCVNFPLHLSISCSNFLTIPHLSHTCHFFQKTQTTDKRNVHKRKTRTNIVVLFTELQKSMLQSLKQMWENWRKGEAIAHLIYNVGRVIISTSFLRWCDTLLYSFLRNAFKFCSALENLAPNERLLEVHWAMSQVVFPSNVGDLLGLHGLQLGTVCNTMTKTTTECTSSLAWRKKKNLM